MAKKKQQAKEPPVVDWLGNTSCMSTGGTQGRRRALNATTAGRKKACASIGKKGTRVCGYTKKDGTVVRAHCRHRHKKKSATPAKS